MKSKRLIKITFPLIVLVAIIFLGPEPSTPVFDLKLPNVPADAAALEKYIADNEARHIIKPNNEAAIVWHDSTHQKTPYAIVYLHGFTASKMEGAPTHEQFAKTFGCNLYLSRLADHGIDTTETLLSFTPDRLWESAKQALAIGKQLGEKVILMSTSTGGTLALKLAAEYPDDVHALINLSPNIAINNGAAFLLNDPWGLYIVRAVKGGKYSISTDDTEEQSKYWYSKYRLEATTQLEELVESTMTKETFQRVKQPSLTLYYFKNEQEQDPQVKVSAMLEMNAALSTPADMKQTVAFADAGGHVIGSSLTNKNYEEVYRAIEKFAVEKLGMKKLL
ncbi:MAG TPA: alpha/beta hydrolase [Ohtaekwangia sp.]|uniref:alpha/beta hydrolase n=1 Tax=Ohtaekwangia sp. TaxID=2066019 RepID=UPI002F93D0C3